MVKRLHTDDKKTRRVAFVVITIVFLASVAALLYWAINVAAARISSRITTHSYYGLLNDFTSSIVLESEFVRLNNWVTI